MVGVQYASVWLESVGVEVKVLCSLGSRAGNWLGGEGGAQSRRSAVRTEGKDVEEGDPLFSPVVLPSLSVSSASQRCGLPAGSPRDLASLGLREDRSGDR